MAREHIDYRANLELLNNRFPECDMLTEQQAMEVTGYKTRTTLRKHLGTSFVNYRISKAAMARWMCGS
jgi:hypothetical protein